MGQRFIQCSPTPLPKGDMFVQCSPTPTPTPVSYYEYVDFNQICDCSTKPVWQPGYYDWNDIVTYGNKTWRARSNGTEPDDIPGCSIHWQFLCVCVTPTPTQTPSQTPTHTPTPSSPISYLNPGRDPNTGTYLIGDHFVICSPTPSITPSNTPPCHSTYPNYIIGQGYNFGDRVCYNDKVWEVISLEGTDGEDVKGIPCPDIPGSSIHWQPLYDCQCEGGYQFIQCSPTPLPKGDMFIQCSPTPSITPTITPAIGSEFIKCSPTPTPTPCDHTGLIEWEAQQYPRGTKVVYRDTSSAIDVRYIWRALGEERVESNDVPGTSHHWEKLCLLPTPTPTPTITPSPSEGTGPTPTPTQSTPHGFQFVPCAPTPTPTPTNCISYDVWRPYVEYKTGDRVCYKHKQYELTAPEGSDPIHDEPDLSVHWHHMYDCLCPEETTLLTAPLTPGMSIVEIYPIRKIEIGDVITIGGTTEVINTVTYDTYAGHLSGANGTYVIHVEDYGPSGKSKYINENGWYRYHDGDQWILTDTAYTTTGSATWVVANEPETVIHDLLPSTGESHLLLANITDTSVTIIDNLQTSFNKMANIVITPGMNNYRVATQVPDDGCLGMVSVSAVYINNWGVYNGDPDPAQLAFNEVIKRKTNKHLLIAQDDLNIPAWSVFEISVSGTGMLTIDTDNITLWKSSRFENNPGSQLATNNIYMNNETVSAQFSKNVTTISFTLTGDDEYLKGINIIDTTTGKSMIQNPHFTRKQSTIYAQYEWNVLCQSPSFLPRNTLGFILGFNDWIILPLFVPI
jgi:hypothetical protein